MAGQKGAAKAEVIGKDMELRKSQDAFQKLLNNFVGDDGRGNIGNTL